jgi:hypothetical protein
VKVEYKKLLSVTYQFILNSFWFLQARTSSFDNIQNSSLRRLSYLNKYLLKILHKLTRFIVFKNMCRGRNSHRGFRSCRGGFGPGFAPRGFVAAPEAFMTYENSRPRGLFGMINARHVAKKAAREVYDATPAIRPSYSDTYGTEERRFEEQTKHQKQEEMQWNNFKQEPMYAVHGLNQEKKQERADSPKTSPILPPTYSMVMREELQGGK